MAVDSLDCKMTNGDTELLWQYKAVGGQAVSLAGRRKDLGVNVWSGHIVDSLTFVFIATT